MAGDGFEDDGEEKMGEIGPRLVIEVKEGTEKAIIEYSSANFPTSLLFFLDFFLLTPIHSSNDKQFLFVTTILFWIIMFLKSLSFSY